MSKQTTEKKRGNLPLIAPLAIMFVMMCALKLWFSIFLFFGVGILMTLITGKRRYCRSYCPLGNLQELTFEGKTTTGCSRRESRLSRDGPCLLVLYRLHNGEIFPPPRTVVVRLSVLDGIGGGYGPRFSEGLFKKSLVLPALPLWEGPRGDCQDSEQKLIVQRNPTVPQ